MIKSDFREITEMLENNYNKKIDNEIFKLWYEEFKNYSISEYENMIKEIIRNEEFMPSLARVIKYKKPTWYGKDLKAVKATDEERQAVEEMLKMYQ